MKGVILNVIEEVVTARYGADTWDQLLEAADLDGAYTALGNYDDADVVALVQAAAAALEVSDADVLRLVGADGFSRLASRYEHFLVDHTSSRTLLACLDDVIHPQVLTLYPGAIVPRFDFTEHGDEVRLEYTSERGLCHLAEGLAAGCVAHFGERATIDQPSCRHEGDDTCVISVRYDR